MCEGRSKGMRNNWTPLGLLPVTSNEITPLLLQLISPIACWCLGLRIPITILSPWQQLSCQSSASLTVLSTAAGCWSVITVHPQKLQLRSGQQVFRTNWQFAYWGGWYQNCTPQNYRLVDRQFINLALLWRVSLPRQPYCLPASLSSLSPLRWLMDSSFYCELPV